jgi:hypothetical protein
MARGGAEFAVADQAWLADENADGCGQREADPAWLLRGQAGASARLVCRFRLQRHSLERDEAAMIEHDDEGFEPWPAADPVRDAISRARAL